MYAFMQEQDLLDLSRKLPYKYTIPMSSSITYELKLN